MNIDREMSNILGRLNEKALIVKNAPKARIVADPTKGLKWVDVPALQARIYGKTIAEAEAKAQETLDKHNRRNGTQWTIAQTESFLRSGRRGSRSSAVARGNQ